MEQLNLKFKNFEYSSHLNCWVIHLDEKIEKERENFSRIFIHLSFKREWDLKKAKEEGKISINFFDGDFIYSPFWYYDMNSGKSTLEIGVMKKIENEWRLRIEGLFKEFKKVAETYEEISKNITNKKTIGELDPEITHINLRELSETLRKWENQVLDNHHLSSQIELNWFDKEVLMPTRRLLQNLAKKKKQIITLLSDLEINYQSMLNTENHNQELRKLPDQIKEIQELLKNFLANEINSSEEVIEINRLTEIFQEISREAEEFNENHPPTPSVTSPKSQEEKQESPTKHSENSEDESPKDQKNHGSKPLIFLLIIVVVALLFIPLYCSFSERGKRKQIQTRKRKTSQLTPS